MSADSRAGQTAAGDFLMPSLGADMDSGTVLEWLVKPGDTVRRGQIIAVVDTSKAAIDVESFTDGVIEDLVVAPGHEVPVGTVLAHVRPAAAAAPRGRVPPPGEAAEAPPPGRAGNGPGSVPDAVRVATPLVRHRAHQLGVDLASLTGTGPDRVITRQDVERAAARAAPSAAPVAPSAAGRAGGGSARLRSSPYARRLAHERGLDVADIAGTGPAGAVIARDVERAGRPAPRPAAPGPAVAEPPVAEPPVAEPPAAEPPAAPTPALAADAADAADAERRRSAVADLMTRSKREIPHFYLTMAVDMGGAVDWLHRANADRPLSRRLLPATLLLRATVLAAREHPHLCGHWRDGAFSPFAAVHLGVAVSRRDGSLIAPRISDADRLSLDDLQARLREIVRRARAGRLRRDEMAEPAITVTNLGDLGVDSVLPVIYPPQVAMVGFGRLAQRPWAVDGLLGIRPVVEVTLAADHRASDGHRGGLFLSSLAEYLRTPEEL